jgi:hypothetical protein
MRIIIVFILLGFLSACSGTGLQSYSAVMTVNTNSQGSVFVLRDTGYSGSGALLNITLNGQQIGKIGNKETAIGRSNSGNNYIEAKFSGIQGIGMNNTQANFISSGRENKYFLIKMTSGLFKNKIQMFEVNESTFKSSF